MRLAGWFMEFWLKAWILHSPPIFPLIFCLFSLGFCVADRRHETSGWRKGVRFGDGDRGRKQLLELVQPMNFVKENDIN